MRHSLEALVNRGEPVDPSKGPNVELRAVSLELTNPRARLSRSESRGRVFSALGELLWYLAGTNATSHIVHYIPKYRQYDEDGVIYGGYGPRLMGTGQADQLKTVIGLLRRKPSSRRAVLQLFDASDLVDEHEDVPCTCVLQFLCRAGNVDMVAFMRSSDAFVGFPHDVFCFTMLQELVARSLGLDLGTYTHMAGSFHLYDHDRSDAEAFLREGWFASEGMPAMPQGDPAQHVHDLLEVEEALRTGQDPLAVEMPADPYWLGLANLLMAHTTIKAGRADLIEEVRARLSGTPYELHLADRLDRGTG